MYAARYGPDLDEVAAYGISDIAQLSSLPASQCSLRGTNSRTPTCVGRGRQNAIWADGRRENNRGHVDYFTKRNTGSCFDTGRLNDVSWRRVGTVRGFLRYIHYEWTWAAWLDDGQGNDDYALKLSKLSGQTRGCKSDIRGCKVVADKVASNLSSLPVDKFRHLGDGEKFAGVPQSQKNDLQSGFGVTPIKQDSDGNWNAHVGFDGYGSHPTVKYPKGVPNQLLARAIESGSSVRQKTPFVRPAVNATKKEAIDAMERVIEGIQKIIGG